MSYRLNRDVTEWRVLAAVQPLFAAPVPWDLATPTDATNFDTASEANATATAVDRLKKTFASEMGEIGINLTDLSNIDLEEQSRKICLEKIKKLLLLLELLVLEQVLHDPDAQEQTLLVEVRIHT
ncbi:hypothetical protein F4859DRAFT_73285 [Xylaria cf. heliscus]|nr:hypothetical protein F4859DRAFT_73285 [Xylaria cf. heliscus]